MSGDSVGSVEKGWRRTALEKDNADTCYEICG